MRFMGVAAGPVHAAEPRFEYERRASKPASPISVRGARANRQESPSRPDDLVSDRPGSGAQVLGQLGAPRDRRQRNDPGSCRQRRRQRAPTGTREPGGRGCRAQHRPPSRWRSTNPPARPFPPRGGGGVAPPVAPVGGVPGAPAGGPLACKLCGSTPAANMTIHEHNGRLLWMVHKTNKGPFCRDCGTALLRHHQNSTLFQGWFGIFSFFITPVTLLLNLVAWQKVKTLGPPHRDPTVASKIPAPLNAGKPLLRRPGPYVAGVVVAAVAVFFGVPAGAPGGCLDSQKTLGNRMTKLHNTFVEAYNRDFKAIDACQSV